MQTTFLSLSRSWCAAKRPLVKHSTMCAYLLTLRIHLLPHFGAKTAITEDEAQAFVFRKLAAGLAKKTVRDIVAVLKAVLRYGRKQHTFPSEEWDIQYPRNTVRRALPTLTIAHQRILMRHLLRQPDAQNIGVLLALCTGMRIGEVCALRWTDVDFIRRLITVRRTVGRIYNCELRATEKIESAPKTANSCREIPIARPLLGCLRAVRRVSCSPYVVGQNGRSKEPRAYRDFFARLLRRLGLPPIVFHGLRHTFATRCIESQCDYKTVSVILGHANVATTLQLYVHPNLQQKQRCVARMSRFLGVEAD